MSAGTASRSRTLLKNEAKLPSQQSKTFGYDPVGNLVSHTDFNGLVITNQYTVLNQLWKRWNGASLLETYIYDAAGQLTNRVDNSGTYGWTFDLRGRVATNSTPFGVLYYAYDSDGNLTNLASATASGVSVAYQYDALNRVTNVVDKRLTGTQNTAYSFDGVGNLQALRYPNAVTNFYQYDSLNRLTNLTWKLNGAQRGDFTYGLGAAGLRTSLSDTVSGTSRTYAWSYDRLYRLTNETVGASAPTGSLTNWYDGVGNRTNRTGSLGSLSALSSTFDVNDQVDNDSITNNANPNFDANGNTRTSGASQYWYDWANRLIAYTNGSAWATLVYDADGNRVRKATAAATNVYLVATVNPSGYPQVVEEFAVAGGTANLAKAYTYGLALISQRAPASSTNFFGHDGHGSTRFLLNPAGSATDTYVYDAFGNLIASNATPATAYLYCGEQFDSDLGCYYLRARYFNPQIGRFWTIDSEEGDQEDPLSLHLYLYCGANPVNRVDKNGHGWIHTHNYGRVKGKLDENDRSFDLKLETADDLIDWMNDLYKNDTRITEFKFIGHASSTELEFGSHNLTWIPKSLFKK